MDHALVFSSSLNFISSLPRLFCPCPLCFLQSHRPHIRSHQVTCSTISPSVAASRSASKLPGMNLSLSPRSITSNLIDSQSERNSSFCPVFLARSEEHTSELQSPCNIVCR